VADFFFYQPYHKIDRHRTPVEHTEGDPLELGSRGEGGPLPEKVDVRKLHRETTAYAEQARKLLGR